MLSSLQSGVAGLRTFQTKLDVIGNNIANSNTVGYRSAHANFADTFNQTLQGSSLAGGPLQVGTGVQVATINNEFTMGSSESTGIDTNLFINGNEGFFIVKNEAGEEFATRAGDFTLDTQGYLVTKDGFRVQGFSDKAAKNGTMSTRGDVRILDDPASRPITPLDPNTVLSHYSILANGRVRMTLEDGSEYDAGQVLLQKFSDPDQLKKEGNNLFSNVRDAGPLGGDTLTSVEPGTNGTGELQSGKIELSNVDLGSEFADMITAQRGFQANARIITTSDEMLQEVVNLKR